ncbi:hypothetical protein [Streptomyces sp. NPDC056361]|uniref:hypothetical protein n=1 Tax=Streptomyces sp. NPDC056361 TaxID=3345795 RepID=UPI0035DA99FC
MSPAYAPGPVRPRALYENWRPPVVGVGVLVPVGADHLVLVRTCGTLAIPTGTVEDAQSPTDAARSVLTGLPGGLPVQRHIAVEHVQMRRRQVTTHAVVTRSLLPEQVKRLTYRDPRAKVCIVPTTDAVAALTERGRARVLLGLQALAIGATAYVDDGRIQLEFTPADTSPRFTFERTAAP